MSSKSRTQGIKELIAELRNQLVEELRNQLVVELRNLSNEVKLLRNRLTGDEALQTKGLIHDVESTAAATKANADGLALVKAEVDKAKAELDTLKTQIAGIPIEDLDRIRWLTKHLTKIVLALLAGGLVPMVVELWRK